MRGYALASSLCLCMATGGCSIAYRPKAQYSGPLTSASPACPNIRGTLVIQRDDVVFTPGEGTWTLEGKAVGPTVQASRSRPSFDHKTFATQLQATVTDTKAIGTYTTPDCTYAVDLTRF